MACAKKSSVMSRNNERGRETCEGRIPLQCIDVYFSFYLWFLERQMAPHSSILAWRIPWTEEPGGLQSMESQRVGHDCATDSLSLPTTTYMTQAVGYTRHPTFLLFFYPFLFQHSVVQARCWDYGASDDGLYQGRWAVFPSRNVGHLFQCLTQSNLLNE